MEFQMLPGQCAPDEIIVHQLGEEWRVTHYEQPDESFKKVDEAVIHALALFREHRHERRRIIVLPPDSPWMWD